MIESSSHQPLPDPSDSLSENLLDDEPEIPTSSELIDKALNNPRLGLFKSGSSAPAQEYVPPAKPVPYPLMKDQATQMAIADYNIKLKTIEQNFMNFKNLLDDRLKIEEWRVPDPANPMRTFNYREWFSEVRSLFIDGQQWRIAGMAAIEMHAEVMRKVIDINDTKHNFEGSMFTFIKIMTDELVAREKQIAAMQKEMEDYKKNELQKYNALVAEVKAHIAGEKVEARQAEQAAAVEMEQRDREQERLEILGKTWDEFMSEGVSEQKWLDFKKGITSKLELGIKSKAKSLGYLISHFKKDDPPFWQRAAYCQVLQDIYLQLSDRFSSEHAANLMQLFVDFARLSFNSVTSGETGLAAQPEES